MLQETKSWGSNRNAIIAIVSITVKHAAAQILSLHSNLTLIQFKMCIPQGVKIRILWWICKLIRLKHQKNSMGTHQGVLDIHFCPCCAHGRAFGWLFPANMKYKNMMNINELNRKMNGEEEAVYTTRREDAKERKRQRMRKQWQCKSLCEHVVSSIMEMGKCIFMIHGGHFYLWSANH